MDLPPDPLPAPSLIDRLRLPRGGAPAGSPRTGMVFAGLMVAGPLLTIGGSALLAMHARSEARVISTKASARIEAARMADAARAELAPLLARPGVGATVETLARIVPGDAVVTRAERDGDGRLSLDVTSPDPDRTRAALRRDPLTDTLRNTAQRAGDGMMIVTFEGPR